MKICIYNSVGMAVTMVEKKYIKITFLFQWYIVFSIFIAVNTLVSIRKIIYYLFLNKDL